MCSRNVVDGQQDVGVIGGVGLELLEHHGEQIVAAHAGEHRGLIRGDGGGVRVVDHHRLHGRIVQFGERLAQLRHVDDARFAAERERCCSSGISSAGAVELEGLRGGELQAAADFLPRSGERRAERRSARTAAPPRSLRCTP